MEREVSTRENTTIKSLLHRLTHSVHDLGGNVENSVLDDSVIK